MTRSGDGNGFNLDSVASWRGIEGHEAKAPSKHPCLFRMQQGGDLCSQYLGCPEDVAAEDVADVAEFDG
jgi:hypothetical protein